MGSVKKKVIGYIELELGGGFSTNTEDVNQRLSIAYCRINDKKGIFVTEYCSTRNPYGSYFNEPLIHKNKIKGRVFVPVFEIAPKIGPTQYVVQSDTHAMPDLPTLTINGSVVIEDFGNKKASFRAKDIKARPLLSQKEVEKFIDLQTVYNIKVWSVQDVLDEKELDYTPENREMARTFLSEIEKFSEEDSMEEMHEALKM